MKGEISRNWYCSADSYFSMDAQPGICQISPKKYICEHLHCTCRHLKYPTPEQFKEEYGEDYPDEGAVYVWYRHGTTTGWSLMSYFEAKKYEQFGSVVCACTPWGRPPNDWRPE